MNLVKWVVGPRACMEIRQEFHAHREECRAALVAEGLAPEAAAAEAVRRIGDEEAYVRQCESELLGQRLGELRFVSAIGAAVGCALVGLMYASSSDSSRPFQQVLCLHLLYGLPIVLVAGACAARLGHWVARLGLLGLGVLVFWLGLFLGTHIGYGAWQAVDNPPEEAFADGAGLVGTLIAGWLPGCMFAGAAFLVSAFARRMGARLREIG